MNNLKHSSKLATRLSALALLALVSTSLVACGDELQAENELPRQYEPAPTEPSEPAPPSPMPFPDFYGNGPGGTFYGHGN
jgi:hypothetical protein